MAFTVRLFGFSALVRLPIQAAQQGGVDSVLAQAEPYIWRQQLVTNGTTAVASAVVDPHATGYQNDPTVILRVEVPDGQSIRYEINAPGRAIAADINSPALFGMQHIPFGPGQTISLIDAAGTT